MFKLRKNILVGGLLLLGLTGPTSLLGKTRPTITGGIRPGEIQTIPSGWRIYLDEGRHLDWPVKGVWVLSDKGGSPLLRVDPGAQEKRESGAEALGIDVEETDLGGSRASKAYLTGKKRPRGRAFDSQSLQKEVGEGAAGQREEKTVDGIKITLTTFPNGASQWTFAWPSGEETLYLDRRKSLVVSELQRKAGALTYQLKQWAEGSFVRLYSSDSGSFATTYDNNDESYRLEFFNPKGELLAELTCKGECGSGE